MKHYKLTAEQMQQVREALEDGVKREAWVCERQGADDSGALRRSRAALALLDASMQAPEATDPLDRPMGGHLLDSVRYPGLPEATAGGDVREALERIANIAIPGHGTEAAIRDIAMAALNGEPLPTWAALAAAPKPVWVCYGSGGGGGGECKDEPIHGTKPEAPTELCRMCGELEESVRHIDALHPSHHPFTPTDATPKDEEPGR